MNIKSFFLLEISYKDELRYLGLCVVYAFLTSQGLRLWDNINIYIYVTDGMSSYVCSWHLHHIVNNSINFSWFYLIGVACGDVFIISVALSYTYIALFTSSLWSVNILLLINRNTLAIGVEQIPYIPWVSEWFPQPASVCWY